jgi:hypothetical protein
LPAKAAVVLEFADRFWYSLQYSSRTSSTRLDSLIFRMHRSSDLFYKFGISKMCGSTASRQIAEYALLRENWFLEAAFSKRAADRVCLYLHNLSFEQRAASDWVPGTRTRTGKICINTLDSDMARRTGLFGDQINIETALIPFGEFPETLSLFQCITIEILK